MSSMAAVVRQVGWQFQLIDRDGRFDDSRFEKHCREGNLGRYETSYVAFGIIGVQGSGKSTLLNLLFGTNFEKMDETTGIRPQTTKGLWLACNQSIKPCTLILDIEGTDGAERGEEDDTSFERKSALFALATVDVLFINMWYYDVGRHNASNHNLLKTVFEAERKIAKHSRRITLFFVIRDTDEECNRGNLEKQVINHGETIWNKSFSEGTAVNATPFKKYFDVQFLALPVYKYRKQEFNNEISELKRKLTDDFRSHTRESLVIEFTESLERLWDDVKENKEIDIPSYTVMLATTKCDEICGLKLSSFMRNEWPELKKMADNGEHTDGMNEIRTRVYKFVNEMKAIVTCYLSVYDEETEYYDKKIRSEKRNELEKGLYGQARETYSKLMRNYSCQILDKCKERLDDDLSEGKGFAASSRECLELATKEFNHACEDTYIEEANWDSATIWDQLKGDMDKHVAVIKTRKLLQLSESFKEKTNKEIRERTKKCLSEPQDDTWKSIRDMSETQSRIFVSQYRCELSNSYELGGDETESCVKTLEGHVIEVVKKVVREESRCASGHMVHRFIRRLSGFDRSSGNIEDHVKTARSDCIDFLSDLAVIRLDANWSDSVTRTLRRCLLNNTSSTELLSSNWDGVERENTLLTPLECKLEWESFMAITDNMYKTAVTQQQAEGGYKDLVHYIVKTGCDILRNSAPHIIQLAAQQSIQPPNISHHSPPPLQPVLRTNAPPSIDAASLSRYSTQMIHMDKRFQNFKG